MENYLQEQFTQKMKTQSSTHLYVDGKSGEFKQ